jgi:hypothetical protein
MNMTNAKEKMMNAKNARRPKTTAAEAALQRQATVKFLTSPGRWGRPKIETLGWKRLAAIYAATQPGSSVRRAINAEARRCGYTPRTILALNAEA